MSEKMMDEFEIVFPKPNHIMRCGKGYVATEYGAWQANDYRQKWIGWQASRAALVVELPANCKGMALTVDELRVMLDEIGVTLK